MSKITEAVELAKSMAADNTHGYDQAHRWGPDYDCSSFVISVWQDVGVPVKSAGASYTGNMRPAFLKCGFFDVTAQINLSSGYGLRAGDVLLNERNHAAMMVSERQLVQASINERGTVTGGQTGDQTGREINERSYYNFPWDCVLRYKEDLKLADPHSTAEIRPISVVRAETFSVTFHVLQLGAGMGALSDLRAEVRALQRQLKAIGFDVGRYGLDGEFGSDTKKAVMAYQRSVRLAADGIVGPDTRAALEGVVV